MNSSFRFFFLGVLTTLAGVAIFNFAVKTAKDRPGPQPSISNISLNNVAQTTPSFPDLTVKKPSQSQPQLLFDESTGPISQFDRDALVKKVIAPYLDYQKGQNSSDIVKIVISQNASASSIEYPFKMTSFLSADEEYSVLVKKTGDELDWWIPECMGPCLITDDFRLRYPEIVGRLKI